MAGPKTQKVTSGLRSLVDGNSPDWIAGHVDMAILSKEVPRIDPGWFHPSSLSKICDAHLGFQFLGEKPREDRFEPRTIKIFHNGHGRDQDWKRYLRDSGLSLVTAKPDDKRKCPTCGGKDYDGRHVCIPELRIRGDFDDHIKNPITGERFIFEFKTKNKALWTKLTEPDPEHVIQTQCYMVAKGETRTIIAYECKDDQQLKCFFIPLMPDLWSEVVSRIGRVLSTLAEGGTLSRTCSGTCDFRICPTADFPKLVEEYKHKMGLA